MKKFDYNFKALWTICNITILKENNIGLNHIINNCYKKIIKFENEFSRFKTDSDLRKLNREKKLEVSDDFLSLIQKSHELYEFTSGYFNPLIDVRTIWYKNSFESWKFEKVDLKEDLDFKNIKNYWNLLEIWKYMNIDFWSIAKWYLADKIKDYLIWKWYKNFLVNMWWDICAYWKNLENKPWQIWILSPFKDWEIIETIEVWNKSISTSWIYLRKWKIWNIDYNHIKNPFTNENQTKLLSVSIIDNFWYKTDSLATAIIAMWYEVWLEFCKKKYLNFLFILDDRSIIKSLNGKNL